MSDFRRGSDPLAALVRKLAVLVGFGLGPSLAAGLCLAAGLAEPLWGGPPQRVVSVNVCTDQLALLLAAPGQLISVSQLALDPLSSSMVDEAKALPVNRGQAEQVFLMHPDLVLAGTYTQAATVALLRGLGVDVVQFAPVNSLAEAADQMRQMGKVLGREAEGRAMAAKFEADLARLRIAGPKVPAAFYFPNGYTTGAGTLSNEVMELTGFANIGASAGLTGGGTLPLERLVMAEPRMIVTSRPYPGASRAEEILTHPALAVLQAKAGRQGTTDADWVCGTPYLLRAVAAMAEARRGLGP